MNPIWSLRTLLKKAGSSNSRSKIRRISKNSPSKKPQTARKPQPADLGNAMVDALSVGHKPPATLSPQDETLFRAFQANLLSLISHELRTPLTGILNALSVLEEGAASGDFSADELVRMARHNAQRLHRTLMTLLDLAALESGTFHVRLREIDLIKLVSARLEAHQYLLRDGTLPIRKVMSAGSPVLAD